MEKFLVPDIFHHNGRLPALSFFPDIQNAHEDIVDLQYHPPSQTLMDNYQRIKHQLERPCQLLHPLISLQETSLLSLECQD